MSTCVVLYLASSGAHFDNLLKLDLRDTLSYDAEGLMAIGSGTWLWLCLSVSGCTCPRHLGT